MHLTKGRDRARRAAQIAPFVAALALAACTARVGTAPELADELGAASADTAPRDGRVVLVTIDGARWQDVFEGSDPSLGGGPSRPPAELMPRALHLAATRGVVLGASLEGCGTVHTAGATNVSLPGYIEIFTGHASRCLDNACEPVAESVLDEAARAGLAGVASIGSWDVLARAVSGGAPGVLVSSGRSWPDTSIAGGRLAELVALGQRADPYPGYGDYRPDVATAAIALEYYRVARPALFHIGLGDTDEYGHRNDYGAYLTALDRADTLIGDLADLLDTMGEEGRRTTVIVTPDHGRNADFRDHGVFHPESSRTFVLAFGGGIAERSVACPTGDLTLADLAPTVRVLVGLPRDRGEGHGRPIALITEAP
jgi:hypothetical protein